MSTQTPASVLDGQCTGIRRALGRYTIDGTERALFGQRIDHTTIRIIDKPVTVTAGHRSYRVDTLDASEGHGTIRALVRDYLTQARSTHRIPAASVTDEWLDDLTDSFRYDHKRAAALKLDTETDDSALLNARPRA